MSHTTRPPARRSRTRPPVVVDPATATPSRVSVVIPALDDAVALETCLSALARQTEPPWEVIVVDNGSRDATADVARRHGATVLHEPRTGIAAAASLGYDAATGDLIGRLDADSIPSPDWLARMRRAADASGADAVTGRGEFVDGGRFARATMTAYLGAYYVLVGAAVGGWPLWGSNVIIRRESWLRARDRIHRYDDGVHDDMDLSFALGPRARTVLERGVVVGVSARSVRGLEQWRRRARRGWRTAALGLRLRHQDLRTGLRSR